MDLFSYLLGKKSSGGGGSDLKVEINNPLQEIGTGSFFINNITKIPAFTYSGTTMYSFFGNLGSLTELDLSNFDVSQVTTMQYCFSGCPSIEEIDASSFGLSACTHIGSMFQNCSKLKKINLSNFNLTTTTKLSTGTYDCFKGCSSLEEIDIRSLDFKNKINQNYLTNMFNGVPTDCLIIVANDTQKNYLLAKLTNYTNIKTVEEYEEIV